MLIDEQEKVLLKLKPGNSPGLAMKAGLWQGAQAVDDQGDVQIPWLSDTVTSILEEVDRTGEWPQWAPAASKVYTAARKLDRYQAERVHGKLTTAENGEIQLDTTSVRTRLICGADVVGVNTYRALTAPLYQSQRRCPLSELSGGASVESVFTEVRLDGAYPRCYLAQMSGQPAMGSHIVRGLLKMSLYVNSTFILIAGDSLYCFQVEETTSAHLVKRISDVKTMLDSEQSAKLDFEKSDNDDFEEEKTDEAGGEKGVADEKFAAITTAVKEVCPPDMARCILETPVINSFVTDTSTSDLRIAGFSKPLLEAAMEIVAGTSEDTVAKNRLKLLKSYIGSIHKPYVALGGAKEILTMNGLASGAFLHEIATAVATTLPVLSSMDMSRARDPHEVLGRVAGILPQGEDVIVGDDKVPMLKSLPSGSADDLLFCGGTKILGLHHVPFDAFECAMMKKTGDLPILTAENVIGSDGTPQTCIARALFPTMNLDALTQYTQAKMNPNISCPSISSRLNHCHLGVLQNKFVNGANISNGSVVLSKQLVPEHGL